MAPLLCFSTIQTPVNPGQLVDDALTEATEPGVGVGAYSHLCEIVHPGADSTKRLVNSGSTNDFLNVNLSWWVTPLLAAGWLMEHCLTRRATYYGLPSPEPHLQPVLDALHWASGLPSDTLLLVPPHHPRLFIGLRADSESRRFSGVTLLQQLQSPFRHRSRCVAGCRS